MNSNINYEKYEPNLSFEQFEIEKLYERHLKNNKILINIDCICQDSSHFKNRLTYLFQKASCIALQYYSELFYSNNPNIFSDNIKLIKNLKCQGEVVKNKLLERLKTDNETNQKSYNSDEETDIEKFEIESINNLCKQHIKGGDEFYTEKNKNILTPKIIYCYCCDNCYEISKTEKEINEIIRRHIENILREIENLPKIGEGWTSEVTLRNHINEILSSYNLECIFHYRPSFLEGLELDLFFEYKENKIGIEYQGEQHFKPIDFFGGKKAFVKLIERDKKKKKLCQANNIRLIYFNFDEPLNKDFIVTKLEKELSISFK